MQIAFVNTPEGNSVPVRLDARTGELVAIPVSDSNQRVLHILPKLRGGGLRSVEATVSSSTLGDSVLPRGVVVVGRPLPNAEYLVAGGGDTRYGWVVPLPDDVRCLDLVITWRGTLPGGEEFQVEHRIDVELLPGPYKAYTMDLACWHRVHDFGAGESPMTNAPWAALAPRLLQTGRLAAFVSSDRNGQDGCIVRLSESLAIPSVPVGDLWSLDAFQELQLHERRHVTSFATKNDVHQAAAAIEMPVSVFRAAVEAARLSDPISTPSFGAYECHPALLVLTTWWNENAPNPANRCAGYAMPWVRVDEASGYACGYGEVPDLDAEHMGYAAAGNARLGDLVILEFMKGAKDSVFEAGAVNFFHVTGQPGSDVGVPEADFRSGAYDEAWYSVQALASFPTRFPNAWQWICAQAEA